MTIKESNNVNDNPMLGFALRTKRISPYLNTEQPITSDVCTDVPGSKCDPDSPYILPALASTTDDNPLFNDFFSVLYELPVIPGFASGTFLPIGDLTIILEEYNGGWSTIATITDNTYGTFFPIDTFPNKPGFTGFKLDWRKVIIAFGEGTYRLQANWVNGEENWTQCHPIHCLNEYGIETANQTVRFEWANNGIITYETGVNFFITDYSNTNWVEMIRLKGGFGYTKDIDEVVDVTRARDNYYETSRIRSKKRYQYLFKSSFYPAWVHSKLKDVAFIGNSLTVTDYRKQRKHDFERHPIIKEADGYDPDYKTENNKCYPVEVSFSNKKEDLGLRQCKVVQSGNCADVTIKNDSGDILQTVPSGGVYVDTGQTGGITPAGIAYCPSVISGQTTSQATNDEPDHLANGVYDYTPPANPVSVATLDLTSLSPFSTLLADNIFSNTNRYTDTLGTQAYANDLVIDHFRNRMWYRVLGANVLWAPALANAAASNQGGFSDWRIPSITEICDIADRENSQVLNYAPFNITTNLVIHSSTNYPSSPASRAIGMDNDNGAMSEVIKASNLRPYLIVRTMY